FAVGGMNPAGARALDALRLKLNEQGFAKVATGPTVWTGWMAGEMRRIRAAEPDAVFVIVGADSGGLAAAKLAGKAVADGLPVAAVVILDPLGKTPAPGLGVRTLTVGGYGSGAESVSIPDATGYSLLTDPRAVEAVTRVLTEVAAGTPQPVPEVITAW